MAEGIMKPWMRNIQKDDLENITQNRETASIKRWGENRKKTQ